jgi:hypothetical protein
MSRARLSGKVARAERHVRLYHSMMKTPAWQSLACVDRCVYIEMERRYGGPGSNNGRIRLALREGARALGVGKTSIAKSQERLQERGFIVLMKRGGFNVKTRQASEWRLTQHVSDVSGHAATKEFERWRPDAKTEDETEPTVNIQNTVPVRGPSVPVGGQHGPCRRTVAA